MNEHDVESRFWGMDDLLRILRPALALLLVGLSPFIAESQATQPARGGGEKRPNWFPPLSQFGGYGSSPGRLLAPRSVALDEENRIFVADTGNHRIQVFTPDGMPLCAWGRPGSGVGEFLFPLGVALGPGQEVFVLDAGNRRVQVFTREGTSLREWSIAGGARFRLELGASIAVSKKCLLLAAPPLPGIRIYSLDGEFQRSVGSTGDGTELLPTPSGIAVDPEDHVYVADAGNHRIRKIDLGGTLLAEWGDWGSQQGFLSTPEGLAFSRGRLFACDSANHRVQVFDPSGSFLSQWGGPVRWPGDGRGLLHFPSAIAASASGDRVVLCEPLEHRCQLFSPDDPHEVHPVTAGWLNASSEHLHASGESGRAPSGPAAPPSGEYAAVLDEGAPALLVYDLGSRSPFPLVRTGRPGRRLAEFSLASSVAMDSRRTRFYVLEEGNQRVQAFDLAWRSEGPGGLPVRLRPLGALAPGPVDGLAIDGGGNLYLLNADEAAVLMFDPSGRRIRSVPLHGGFPREKLSLVGVAVSPAGDRIYVLDQWGSGVLAYQADGGFGFSWGARSPTGESPLPCPSGIAADSNGFVYVADSARHAILKFDAQGAFVSSWGRYGSRPGEFSSPRGIWLTGHDRLIVDDAGNHRGQVFTLGGAFVSQLPKGASPGWP